ncbi:MAG: hypothetical protein DRP35_03090 [Candidatus Zixiibacteriota bacterium]|nr:MAG: hypothetical protein DRP35_03090 [candidate division Zixibacteria bacterium]
MLKSWNKILITLATIVLMFVMLYPVYAEEEKKDPTAPMKNLQFQAAEINSVLNFLADYGGVNVVVSPKVKGTVTIKLNDILWRDAMDIIARTYGLVVVEEKQGYLRVLNIGDYHKEVSEYEKHNKEQREIVSLETKIVQISNSSAEDIVSSVKSLLTPERGQAIADIRSNSIIVQEIPDNMETVLKFIAELDKPAKQIKISAQMLEVFTKDIEELGISWGASGTYATESGRSFEQEANVFNRTSDPAGSYQVFAIQNGWSVDAVVEAIVNSGKGKVLAHPEITTVDNKEARIQMGQKIPVKQFDESGNIVITFEEVGTILKVTPHITAEDRILMHLVPERSTYEYDPNGVIISISTAETNVIVENGQTAVIGGLTTQDEVSNEVGVPILKDIPIVGLLFKYTNNRLESRDLVIFVTPTIIEDGFAMEG